MSCEWSCFFVSGLAVCNITGMRSITLLITWLTSLSGNVRAETVTVQRVKIWYLWNITVISDAFFQSSAADVFYCIFNRRKDSHASNRRQVAHTQTDPHIIIIICTFSWTSRAVSFLYDQYIFVNNQRSDSGRTAGAEYGAARRRHLHGQRISKGKASVKSMKTWPSPTVRHLSL